MPMLRLGYVCIPCVTPVRHVLNAAGVSLNKCATPASVRERTEMSCWQSGPMVAPGSMFARGVGCASARYVRRCMPRTMNVAAVLQRSEAAAMCDKASPRCLSVRTRARKSSVRVTNVVIKGHRSTVVPRGAGRCPPERHPLTLRRVHSIDGTQTEGPPTLLVLPAKEHAMSAQQEERKERRERGSRAGMLICKRARGRQREMQECSIRGEARCRGRGERGERQERGAVRPPECLNAVKT